MRRGQVKLGLKRIMVTFIAFVMVFGSFPSGVYATETLSAQTETFHIPASGYANIGQGDIVAGVIRAGTGGGNDGRGGAGFLANTASYWSGINNGNTGVVGTGRSAFFRVVIPEHINPMEITSMQLAFNIRDTHNQAPYSLSLFSLENALPENLRAYHNIWGANAAPIKARYPGRAHIATSNLITVAGGAASGLSVTFDVSDYFWNNPARVFEFTMLADSQMLGLHDSTAPAHLAPRVIVTTNEPVRSLTASDSAGSVAMAFNATEMTFSGTTYDSAVSLTVVSGLRDYESITIGGISYASGQATAPIALDFGVNNIPVVVTTAGGGVSQFTVIATRVDPRVPLHAQLDTMVARRSNLLADIDRRGGTLVVDTVNPVNTIIYLDEMIADTREMIDGVTDVSDPTIDAVRDNFIILDRIIGYRLRRTFVYDAFFGIEGFHSFNYHFRAYGALPPGGQTTVPMNDWRDNQGRLIQSHGGQVQRLRGFWALSTPEIGVDTIIVPADENTGTDDWWVWVGEDKTRSARPVDGITAYVSRDLLNWIFMGVIMHPHDVVPVRSTQVDNIADAAHGTDGAYFIWDRIGGGQERSRDITGPASVSDPLWGFELHMENLNLMIEWAGMQSPGIDSVGNEVTQNDISRAAGFLLAYRRADNPNEFYMDELKLAFENLFTHYNIIERPKMLFNEVTEQYVIVFHADGPSDLNISRWLRAVEDSGDILRMDSSRYTRALVGFAVSDSPFGPFRLVNVSRGNWLQTTMNSIGGSNHALNIQRQGEARDMTAFSTIGELLDNRGNPVIENGEAVRGQVAYVVYSSEMNQHTYISRLAPCFTRMAAPQIPFVSRDNNLDTNYADELVHGRHFQQRVFTGVPPQEAQAVFSFEDTYYMINSGTHGWGVFGPGARHYNFRTDSVLSTWQYTGNPVLSGSDTRLGATFGLQSTYVFPYDPVNGLFIFMGNRWVVDDAPNAPIHQYPLPSGGSAAPFSTHIWIPVQLNPDTGTFNVINMSDWTLEDLRLLGRAPLIVQNVIAIDAEADLPETIEIEGNELDVTWSAQAHSDAATYAYYVPFSATGIITYTGRSFSIQVIRIPLDTVYFIDSIGESTLEEVGGSTRTFDAVAGLLGENLINEAPDQAMDAQYGTWGHGFTSGSRGVATVGTNVWNYGHWGDANAEWQVRYYLTLPPGTYRITSGHQEWWNTATARHLSATVELADNEIISLSPESITFAAGAAAQFTTGIFTGEFTIYEETTVIYRVNSINRPANPQGAVISWLAVGQLEAFDEKCDEDCECGGLCDDVNCTCTPEPKAPVVFSGSNPNMLKALLSEGDVELQTAGNLGIFTHHSPFVIPAGRTLTVTSTLNVQGNAELHIYGTLVVRENGRVNNQGGNGGTIVIKAGGELENNGHVENVTNSAVVNYGTIVNNARFEVRANTSLHNCGLVIGTTPLRIHRDATIVICAYCAELPE